MYKTLTTEFMRTNKYVANVRQGPLVNYNKKVLAKVPIPLYVIY